MYDLSVNGFCSNQNLEGGLWLDDEGYLLQDQQGYTTIKDGRELRYGDRISDAPIYTLETDESGFVTAVNMEWEANWRGGLDVLPVNRAILATAAFQGSDVGVLELAQSPILETLNGMGELPEGEPVTVQSGEFTATLTFSGENYQVGSFGLIYKADDGQPSSCHFTFRLEKNR